MKAIVVHELGGPQVLSYEACDDPVPQPDEALVRLEAAGVNFLDIYYREGFHWGGHHRRSLPYTPGAEGAGRVVAAGNAVTEIEIGDRVAFGVSNGYGAYAELIAIKSRHLVKLPGAMSAQIAAAVMQQGMTAHYLTSSTYPLKPTDVAMVHAAAGGTGLLLVQMAKLRGARVIGIVSGAGKAEVVRAVGADHVLVSQKQDFEVEARRLTGGRGVNVVYDSVGKATFDKSLNCLAPLGTMVLYGQSSGAVPPFDTAVLNAKGSLFLARPSLTHYVADRKDLEWRTSDIFRWIIDKNLDVRIDQAMPLQEAPKAHERLASRQSIGKILLLPWP
ncbi:MAG: quinone oxidoreductase [Xanthobacteraceae bacterium]